MKKSDTNRISTYRGIRNRLCLFLFITTGLISCGGETETEAVT